MKIKEERRRIPGAKRGAVSEKSLSRQKGRERDHLGDTPGAAREVFSKGNSLIANAGDGIVTLDAQGRITSWNSGAEPLYRYQREEILGRPMSLLFPQNRRNELRTLQEKVRQGAVVRNCETQGRRKDGTLADILLTLSPIKDVRGRFTGFVGIVRDISQKRRAEEAWLTAQAQILRLQKLASIGRLMPGACHEILNLLNVISIQAQLALANLSPEPHLREKLQNILEQVQRSVKVIDQVRRFSRKEPFAKTRLQINEVAMEVLSLLRHELRLANVRVHTKLHERIPSILGDFNQLSQVFLNLISNAKDAMPHGGTLTVSTRMKRVNGKKTVEILFSDTGCGIPRKHHVSVFDPFFTTKPEDHGAGLGLSISHEIMESHKGKIGVKSEEGKGSTFRVELPAATEENGHAEDLDRR